MTLSAPMRGISSTPSFSSSRGGSSLFGTGISPGLVELVGLVVAGMCDRIDKITVNEAAYTMGYDSPETEKPAGFGRPIDDPDLPKMTAAGTAVFAEAVAMVADALGVELDDVVCEAEYANRRPRTSISVRGRSRRGAWPALRRAGKDAWARGPWSS
jgi:hypothetical protein